MTMDVFIIGSTGALGMFSAGGNGTSIVTGAGASGMTKSLSPETSMASTWPENVPEENPDGAPLVLIVGKTGGAAIDGAWSAGGAPGVSVWAAWPRVLIAPDNVALNDDALVVRKSILSVTWLIAVPVIS
jgi:hypothetical protein